MIIDRKGYDGTKRFLEELKSKLEELRKQDPEAARKAIVNADIEQLENELKEFEDTVLGANELPDISQLVNMPERFIKWRLVKRWSLEELAEKAKVDFAKLLVYEATEYSACTLREMLKLADVLQNEVPENPVNELS